MKKEWTTPKQIILSASNNTEGGTTKANHETAGAGAHGNLSGGIGPHIHHDEFHNNIGGNAHAGVDHLAFGSDHNKTASFPASLASSAEYNLAAAAATYS